LDPANPIQYSLAVNKTNGNVDVFLDDADLATGVVYEWNGAWSQVWINTLATYYPSMLTNLDGSKYLFFQESDGVLPSVMTVQNLDSSNQDLGKYPFGDVAPYGVKPFANNGVIYAAYRSTGNQLSVAGFDTAGALGNNSFTPIGPQLFTPGEAFTPAITTDNNGTVYVAFADAAHSNKLAVMKYNGASWVSVGTPNLTSSTITCFDTTIDLSAYDLPTMGGYPSAGNTHTYQSTAICTDADGNVYVTFEDVATTHAEILKWNGTAWSSITANYNNYAVTNSGTMDPTMYVDGNTLVVNYRKTDQTGSATFTMTLP
jgi:hypothetical protein